MSSQYFVVFIFVVMLLRPIIGVYNNSKSAVCGGSNSLNSNHKFKVFVYFVGFCQKQKQSADMQL